MEDKSSQLVSASADMGVGGVAATTEGAMMSGVSGYELSRCTQDWSITYGRQTLEIFDEEAYDQGCDSDGNLGPFYDIVEDEEYAYVYEEEEAPVGDPDAQNNDETKASEEKDAGEGEDFIGIPEEVIINMANEQLVEDLLERGQPGRK